MKRHVLRAKTTVPANPGGSVHRHAILGQLLEDRAAVWWVSGPAGFGKTTVLSQAAGEFDGVVAWVSCDPADNDPVRFWTHVVAALLADHQEPLTALLELIEPSTVATIADELAAYLDLSSQPHLLVLDDIDTVSSPQSLQPLEQLILRPPASLTIALAGRTTPDLPISRLRAHERLRTIDSRDLAFSPDEARTSLGVAAAEALDPATLVMAVDGWPAAVRMAALAQSSGAKSRALLDGLHTLASVESVLADEIVGALPAGHRQFLIRTSLLDTLLPELCAAITGNDDALAILRDLERRQMFTTCVDQDTREYRYHAVLKSFLRRRAEELPSSRRQTIHRAAAQWFRQHREPGSAVAHAVQAGDHDTAKQIVQESILEVSMSGYIVTARGWLETLGIERCMDDPDLSLIAAWAALNAGDYTEALEWATAAANAAERGDVLAQVLTIESHVHRHQGRLAAALDAATRAVEVSDGTGGENHPPGIEKAALALAQAVDGSAAPDELRSIAAVARASGDTATHVAVLSVLALVSTDGVEASEAAHEALALVSSPTLERFHQPALAHLAISKVRLASDRPGDAAEAAKRSVEIASAAHEPLFECLARLQLATALHRLGDQEAVRSELRASSALLDRLDAPQLDEQQRRARNATRFEQPSAEGTTLDLTQRELSVLALLPSKLTRREIAEQLYVSDQTVKSYMTILRNKLGVSGNRRALVARARELGLLDDP